MRYAFVQTLMEEASHNDRIVLVTGDLGFTVFEKFRENYPKRFMNVGVAEGNMVGFATGLALSGKIVFCYSIATFATMRPFEQIRNCVAAHSAPVIIVGTGAGLSYGHASYTHFGVEDIGLMRLIPGMTIYCPADPMEVRWATHNAIARAKPAYLRLGMKGEQALYDRPSFGVGKGTIVKKGDDVAIVAVGNILANAMKAAELLEGDGIDASVIGMHTIKPIDTKLIKNLSSQYPMVVTVEEHSTIGGLGSTVSDVLTEIGSTIKLCRIGIPDEFIRTIGSQTYLREKLGLSPEGIARTVLNQYKRLGKI
ncbi:hypothetical protein HY409_01515 [Candidatus Gottesmanbacteria bacterium]|nr:hypothetical protein [Candidatus Gottesmanbacteria bacterium]